ALPCQVGLLAGRLTLSKGSFEIRRMGRAPATPGGPFPRGPSSTNALDHGDAPAGSAGRPLGALTQVKAPASTAEHRAAQMCGHRSTAAYAMERAMNEWSNAKLCDVANLILGAFLLLSPWIIIYSGRPAQNAVISGAVIAVLSIAALAAFAQWE